MTQEDKELLLKDLCARIPYGVKFACNKNIYIAKGIDLIVTDEGDWRYAVTAKGIVPIEIDFIKPYLFPLSSMTREQLFEVQEILGKNEIEIEDGFLSIIDSNRNTITYLEILALLNWFYKNHFDINGLIPMGLAIDATGLNIY